MDCNHGLLINLLPISKAVKQNVCREVDIQLMLTGAALRQIAIGRDLCWGELLSPTNFCSLNTMRLITEYLLNFYYVSYDSVCFDINQNDASN